MNKLLALTALIVTAGAAAAAPPTAESIEQLLDVTHVDRTVEVMMTNIEKVFGDAMNRTVARHAQDHPPNPAQQKILDAIPGKLVRILREELSPSVLRPRYLQIYREFLTQEEVDGMLAFYRTPAGLATIDKMPAVMERSMALTAERTGPMMQKIEALINQMSADLTAANSE